MIYLSKRKSNELSTSLLYRLVNLVPKPLTHLLVTYLSLYVYEKEVSSVSGSFFVLFFVIILWSGSPSVPRRLPSFFSSSSYSSCWVPWETSLKTPSYPESLGPWCRIDLLLPALLEKLSSMTKLTMIETLIHFVSGRYARVGVLGMPLYLRQWLAATKETTHPSQPWKYDSENLTKDRHNFL